MQVAQGFGWFFLQPQHIIPLVVNLVGREVSEDGC